MLKALLFYDSGTSSILEIISFQSRGRESKYMTRSPEYIYVCVYIYSSLIVQNEQIITCTSRLIIILASSTHSSTLQFFSGTCNHHSFPSSLSHHQCWRTWLLPSDSATMSPCFGSVQVIHDVPDSGGQAACCHGTRKTHKATQKPLY